MEDHRSQYPIRIMCGVLEVSPSGYYAWRGRPESTRAAADRGLAADIRRVHADSRSAYGSPRVHAALRAEGRRVGVNRVARLMRHHGIQGRHKRRVPRTTDSKHALPIAPNLLGRKFTASAPNQVWLADITYVSTNEGWLYLAVVLDLFSRRVVGWAMRETMPQELTITALQMAITNRRPGPGLVHHSDRGSQYAAQAYRKLLGEAGMVCSMSRKGDCWDKAPIESFFGSMKCELDDGQPFETRQAARNAVFAFIEGFYNRRRLHSAIGYRSPADMENVAAAAKAVTRVH
jgi:putative transposase